jgi:hypothetical protein
VLPLGAKELPVVAKVLPAVACVLFIGVKERYTVA